MAREADMQKRIGIHRMGTKGLAATAGAFLMVAVTVGVARASTEAVAQDALVTPSPMLEQVGSAGCSPGWEWSNLHNGCIRDPFSS